MTLEQAIHQRWAAYAPLNNLLAADRLTTGRALRTEPPHATLRREKTQTVCHTNDGRIDEIGLRIDLWYADFGAGRAVIDQIGAAFGGCSLDLDADEQVLVVRCTNQSDSQHDDGLWQFTVLLSARLYLPLSDEP